MKFYVARTSGKTPPCAEAKRETVSSMSVFGDITTDEEWVVELNTLDELIEFNDKYGGIIIRDYWYAEGKAIEIYDDYRE